MSRRRRPGAQLALRNREGFVDDAAAVAKRRCDRRKQIALQISRDDHDVEYSSRKRRHGEIGAPAPNPQRFARRDLHRLSDSIEFQIDTERFESMTRQQQRVTSASHRDIEGFLPFRRRDGERRDPFRGKCRRQS